MEQQGPDSSQSEAAPSTQEAPQPQPHTCTEACVRTCLAALEEEHSARVLRTKADQARTGVFDSAAVAHNLALTRQIVGLREQFGLVKEEAPETRRALFERFVATLAPDWGKPKRF